MPRGDGTGPWGVGPMTARGLGSCPAPASGWVGRGGRFWGFQRPGFRAGMAPPMPVIEEERAILQKQLEAVQASLASLSKLIEERGK